MFKDGLVKAHNEGSRVIRKANRKPEPRDTALVAEAHRWFWKPTDVKFIVVAESHVYTSRKENAVKMRLDKIQHELPEFPADAPLRFVKLVYCLGYGISEILDGKIEPNTGTPDYWKFFSIWTKSFRNIQESDLQWKFRVLRAMQKYGVWLLDASCHACSIGNRIRLDTSVVEDVVSPSWENYVGRIIEAAKPQEVWVIGKGIHDILGNLPDSLRGNYVREPNWIYQPNFPTPRNSRIYYRKRARESKLRDTIWRVCKVP